MNKKVDIAKFDDEEEYIIFFISPNKQIMFLAYLADVNAICYNLELTLPGTLDYQLAKRYKTLEAAKDDIYKLRYYRREFLKVTTGIKKILKNSLDTDNSLVFYCEKNS